VGGDDGEAREKPKNVTAHSQAVNVFEEGERKGRAKKGGTGGGSEEKGATLMPRKGK